MQRQQAVARCKDRLHVHCRQAVMASAANVRKRRVHGRLVAVPAGQYVCTAAHGGYSCRRRRRCSKQLQAGNTVYARMHSRTGRLQPGVRAVRSCFQLRPRRPAAPLRRISADQIKIERKEQLKESYSESWTFW
jgi:hypothetical protein